MEQWNILQMVSLTVSISEIGSKEVPCIMSYTCRKDSRDTIVSSQDKQKVMNRWAARDTER